MYLMSIKDLGEKRGGAGKKDASFLVVLGLGQMINHSHGDNMPSKYHRPHGFLCCILLSVHLDLPFPALLAMN